MLTLIMMLFFQPLQNEVDFIKVKNQNQYQTYNNTFKNQKLVCYVLGNTLSLEEWVQNRDKYDFIFFPDPTESEKSYFKMEKGVILANKVNNQLREYSRQQTFTLKIVNQPNTLNQRVFNKTLFYGNCPTGNCPRR